MSDIQDQLDAMRLRIDFLERSLDRLLGKQKSILPEKHKPVALPVKCPECGAAPGERCRTQSDRIATLHLARVKEDARRASSR